MDKFQNKYRITTARARFWDYGWNAAYFVTICTKNREHFFGEIHHGEMELSDIGKIAKSEWIKTFEMRPDMNLWMGEYVVMPDHFHAIIGIGKNKYNTNCGADRTVVVDTQCIAYLPPPPPSPPPSPPSPPPSSSSSPPKPPPSKNKFGPQSKNLPSIIRGFKIGVTKNARSINPDFAWQSRYHDHIIRNEKSFNTISNYIINNPQNWDKDKLNK